MAKVIEVKKGANVLKIKGIDGKEGYIAIEDALYNLLISTQRPPGNKCVSSSNNYLFPAMEPIPPELLMDLFRLFNLYKA